MSYVIGFWYGLPILRRKVLTATEKSSQQKKIFTAK